MSDALLRFREEFPILATTNYLVSNSLGAMPRDVAGQLKDYTREWETRGVRAWAQGWWDGRERGREVSRRLDSLGCIVRGRNRRRCGRKILVKGQDLVRFADICQTRCILFRLQKLAI